MKTKTKFELATGVYLYPAFTTTPNSIETYYYFASAEERMEAKNKMGRCLYCRPKKIFVVFEEAEKLYTETLNKMP